MAGNDFKYCSEGMRVFEVILAGADARLSTSFPSILFLWHDRDGNSRAGKSYSGFKKNRVNLVFM